MTRHQFTTALPRATGYWLSLTLSLVIWTSTAAAAEPIVHLQDGTQIRGEIVSLKGGAYEIRSNSLGTLRVPQDQVRLVDYNPATTSAGSGTEATLAGAATLGGGRTAVRPASGAVVDPTAGLTNRLQADPDLMRRVLALAGEPAMQAVLADPTIQQAIAAGDYESLLNNPKMRRLLGHSEIRALTGELKNSR